jgi:hypothetical protein
MDIRYTWVVTVCGHKDSRVGKRKKKDKRENGKIQHRIYYIAGRSRTYPFTSNYAHPSDKRSPAFERKLTPGVGLEDCTVLP